jgi:hypothetical protein
MLLHEDFFQWSNEKVAMRTLGPIVHNGGGVLYNG